MLKIKYIFCIIFVLIKCHLTTLYAEECLDLFNKDSDRDLHYERALESFNNKNYGYAEKLFNISAGKGNKDAQYYVGLIHDVGLGVNRNPMIADYFYKKAFDNGNVKAGLRLGLKYLYGIDDSPIDYKVAKHLLSPAIKEEYPYVKFYVSMMYLNGWGVSKNDDLAWKFFESFIESMQNNGLRIFFTSVKEGLISVDESIFMNYGEITKLLEVSKKYNKSGIFEFIKDFLLGALFKYYKLN